MNSAAPLHPILVHFSVALTTASVLFDFASLLLGGDSLADAGWWTLALSAVMTVGTVATGVRSRLRLPMAEGPARSYLRTHMALGPIAHRFARDGARLGLIARDRDRLEATRREVESLGGTAIVCPADVADAGALDRAADRIEQELGPIGIWVNNAMASVFSPVTAMSPDEYRRVTEVTYLGCVFGTLAALRCMETRNQGVIIQVGSALAYRSIPLQSAYCGAKHAVLGFTASLRCELIHRRSRIRVTMVQMPAMNTPQFEWVRNRMPRRAQPVPPIFQPEVCAEAVHYSAYHDVGREMLVGWPTVQAVWGNKLVPALLDRYLGRTGFESQQAEELAPAGGPDNLWQPVPGGWGAHGRFDDRARRRSFQIWLRLRPAVAAATLAATSLAAAWLLLR